MGARLFVGNLNPQTTKDRLVRFFSPAGKVVSVSVPVDRATGRSRGFAFIELEDREAAQQAFEVCDGRELDGQEVRLSWARDRDGGGRPRAARGARPPLSDEPEAVDERRGEARSVRSIDDYVDERSERPRGHGKHGCDRKRGRGTRRWIE